MRNQIHLPVTRMSRLILLMGLGKTDKQKMQPTGRKWIYYMVAGLLALVYYAGEFTNLLFLAMLIILPVGFWVLWNIHPDKPAD